MATGTFNPMPEHKMRWESEVQRYWHDLIWHTTMLDIPNLKYTYQVVSDT